LVSQTKEYFIATKIHHKVLLSLTLGSVCLAVIGLLDLALHMHLTQSTPFLILSIMLPVLLLLLYGTLALGYRRTLLFLVLSAGIGFIAEAVSVNRVGAFGSNYVYQYTPLMAAEVPLLIPLYWAVFIYTSYNLATALLVWIGVGKPHRDHHNWYLLPFLILLDGLAVTAIDLVMDPVIVNSPDWRLVSWRWLDGGEYFGVPIGNFLGWFIVALSASGLFRIFEYVAPPYHAKLKQSYYILPVIGYAMLGLGFISKALELDMPVVALVGIAVMIPMVLANAVVFVSTQLHS
jgi:putative membrane protein